MANKMVDWALTAGAAIWIVMFATSILNAAVTPPGTAQASSNAGNIAGLVIALLFVAIAIMIYVLLKYGREGLFKMLAKIRLFRKAAEKEISGYGDIYQMLVAKKGLSELHVAQLDQDASLNVSPSNVALFKNTKGRSFASLVVANKQVQDMTHLNKNLKLTIDDLRARSVEFETKQVKEVLGYIDIEKNTFEALEDKLKGLQNIKDINKKLESLYGLFFKGSKTLPEMQNESAQLISAKMQAANTFINNQTLNVERKLGIDLSIKEAILKIVNNSVNIRTLLDDLEKLSLNTVNLLNKEAEKFGNIIAGLNSGDPGQQTTVLSNLLNGLADIKSLAKIAKDAIDLELKKYNEFSQLLQEQRNLIGSLGKGTQAALQLGGKYFGETLKIGSFITKAKQGIAFNVQTAKGPVQVTISNLNDMWLEIKSMPNEEFDRKVDNKELSKWVRDLHPDLAGLAKDVEDNIENEKLHGESGKNMLVELIESRYKMDAGELRPGRTGNVLGIPLPLEEEKKAKGKK